MNAIVDRLAGKDPLDDPSRPLRPPMPIRPQARPTAAGAHRRWSPLRIVAAGLVLFVLASVLVLDEDVPPPVEQPAIPVAQSSVPAMSTELEFDAATPDIGGPNPSSWTHSSASMQKVAPGAAFTTDQPWYTAYDGPLLLMVLDGSLDLRVAGPALFYAAGTVDLSRPVRPGELLHLAAHDGVVYSLQDGAAGNNPEDREMVAFVGMAGRADSSVTGSNVFPAGVELASLDDNTSPLNLTGDATTLSVERLQLASLDTYVFDPDPSWRYLVTFDPTAAGDLRVYNGALDAFDLTGGHASWKLQALGEGPHTLANLGENPIDLYFMVVEEDSDAGSPPA